MSLEQPILPYAGTSGWSGSETSRQRAQEQDSDGTTGKRQRETLEAIRMAGEYGVTWKELGKIKNWHHGQASGVLSVLHKAGLIERLLQNRNKCAVYVLAGNTLGRPTAQRKIKTCKHCGGHL